MDHPFIATLTRSGPVGQTILAGLLVLSIFTWVIIFWKSRMLRDAERATRGFLVRFRDAGVEWLRTGGGSAPEGPAGRLYEAGAREFQAQREIAGMRDELTPEAIARIEAGMDAESTEQIAELEKGHIVLAIAASASPFIGLFGTVWGIMNAFRGMSLEGSAGIAAVAPGVAEALVTTVAGLAVAIPSVVAFNLLNRKVQLITSMLDRFTNEFLRATQFAVRREGRGAVPTANPGDAPAVFARPSG